ncbi:MAG TPA: hypothetical protein ENL22_05085 [candidate division Zixibacteria bacterium]|nr:hypothetical protein [candidate division Zixibacteria bacterium]
MVQPVDIADNLSKTELVSKLNQMKKASSEMEQRQVTKTLKEKTSADAERTQESMKSDMLIITRDKQEREKKKKERKKKEESDSQDDADMEKSDNEHLDLKA